MLYLSQFPCLQSNEHLLSVAIRACRLSGHRSIKHYFNRHFHVDPRLRPLSFVSHPLQSAVATLYAEAFKVDLQSLLWNHTNLRYFFNALPTARQRGLLDSGDSSYQESDLNRLSPKCNLNLDIPWRWCPDCTQEDLERCGFTYWHVDHQIPGLIHCSRHGTTAIRERCNSCGMAFSSLDGLELPPIGDLCPACGATFPVSSSVSRAESDLAQAVVDWLELAPGALSAERLQQRYHIAARQNGRFNVMNIAPLSAMASCTLNARLQPLFEQFHGKPFLEGIARRYRFRGQTLKHRITLHRLMTDMAIYHPVHHLLAIRFFSGTLSSFLLQTSWPDRTRGSAQHSAIQQLRSIRI